MTDVYSLGDKIYNIRKAIRNLTGDTSSPYESELHSSTIKITKSDPLKHTQGSLENFLEEKYEEDQKYNRKNLLHSVVDHTIDYTKDEESISRTSFKYPNNQILSFASDEIKDYSGIKFQDGKENFELAALLENERENVKKLENRILKKDEIINNMHLRQNNLSVEISELKKKNSSDTQIEEYKAIITNLQEKIEKYSDQILYLQTQSNRFSGTPDFKASYIEELQAKISHLEKQNEELVQSKNEYMTINSKQRQDSQILQDLKYSIERKDREIFEILEKNKELQIQLSDFQNAKKDSRQEFREFKLKEEITRLKQENDEINQKILSAQQKTEESTKQRKRSCSSNNALSEISKILKCSNSEIIPKLKKLKKSEKLEKRLEKLIKDLSPKNAILTTKHIWKCIRKLIEEYLVIKKKTNDENISEKLSALLGVNHKELYEEVKKICEERKNTGKLVEKIKKMLCLSPHAALREVEDTIDEKV